MTIVAGSVQGGGAQSQPLRRAISIPQTTGKARAIVDLAAKGRLMRHASMAAGILMLLGSLVDLGTLWILQRESSPQWEFAAISNTVDAIPRLVFALGFLVLALYFKENATVLGYRLIAVGFLLIGAGSLALGGLIAMSYFPLAKLATQPEVYTMLRSITIKTLALSGIYFLVTVPIGLAGLRRLVR